MSRVGKQPISIPSGVTVKVDGGIVAVSGPKGNLSCEVGKGVSVALEGGKILVGLVKHGKQENANFGTTRAKLNNMVKGVSQGWKRSLEMSGVGFTAKLAGQSLTLTVGFSHEVNLPIPKVVKCTVAKTTIDLESPDKEEIGRFAATIRKTKKPEPYLGKGIRYSDEVIRRKQGKTGKK